MFHPPNNTSVATEIVCAVLLDTVPQFDQPVTAPSGQQSGRGVKLHRHHRRRVDGLQQNQKHKINVQKRQQ